MSIRQTMQQGRIYTNRVTHALTGEHIEYQYKLSWGRKYYSFDDGTTWHRTKTKAYAAREAGRANDE